MAKITVSIPLKTQEITLPKADFCFESKVSYAVERALWDDFLDRETKWLLWAIIKAYRQTKEVFIRISLNEYARILNTNAKKARLIANKSLYTLSMFRVTEHSGICGLCGGCAFIKNSIIHFSINIDVCYFLDDIEL